MLSSAPQHKSLTSRPESDVRGDRLRDKAAGFPCSPDCLAERGGFELSVPFPEPRKRPHVRELVKILQPQHTSGELVKGCRGARLVRFHDLEKSEWPVIVRLKEIRISGVLPTPEMVSRDCLRAGQSEIELFSVHPDKKPDFSLLIRSTSSKLVSGITSGLPTTRSQRSFSADHKGCSWGSQVRAGAIILRICCQPLRLQWWRSTVNQRRRIYRQNCNGLPSLRRSQSQLSTRCC
jgi:hypothetical protein